MIQRDDNYVWEGYIGGNILPSRLEDGFSEEDIALSASVYPENPDEYYDGIDSNCLQDSDCDSDGDSFDAIEIGYCNSGNDCNDESSDVFPDAPEVCDGLITMQYSDR